MAELIEDGYKQIIKKVQNGRYLQMFYQHIYEDGEAGCIFTEREYKKRKAQGQL